MMNRSMITVEPELIRGKARIAIGKITQRRGQVIGKAVMDLVKQIRGMNDSAMKYNSQKKFWQKSRPEYFLEGLEDVDLAEILAIPINYALGQNLHEVKVTAFEDDFYDLNLQWCSTNLDKFALQKCEEIWSNIPITPVECEAHRLAEERHVEGKDCYVDLRVWNWINHYSQPEN